VRHQGQKAVFSIVTPNDGTLSATGSFREDGHNVGMVSYDPQLTAWIRLPACSLSELTATMKDAAHSLGGNLTVQYTRLTDNLSALEPTKHASGPKVVVSVELPAPLLNGNAELKVQREGRPRTI
jgi:hypothetical protein